MKAGPSFPEQSLSPPVELNSLRIALLIAGTVGVFTANPLESVFAVAQLFVFFKAYWRQNTPPVILLLFLIPWLEVSTGILEANLRSESLDAMLHGSGRAAYWLSALGLFAVHAGFYTQFKKSNFTSIEALKSAASKLSLIPLILAYFAVGPTTSFIAGFLGRGSGLYQFATYLNEVSLVILIIICLRQSILNEVNRLFIAFASVVLFLSFYSFFSEWRTVLFALFISFGTIQSLSTKAVARILIISVIFGNIIFLWQGIKPLYRAYLTGQETLQGGLQSQALTRSRSEALAKFIELSQQFYAGELKAGNFEELEAEELLYSTLRRVGYLEFMALTLNNVPSRLDHENGRLLSENLSFALIPRILNPDKGVKDDGAKVTKYTEFMVSATASFSLGHYVEFFIDFGQWGMMLALFVYGFIGGRIYRYIASDSRGMNHLMMCGVLFVTLQHWGSYQNDAIWIYGLTFFGFICHLFLFRPIYGLVKSLTKAQ